MLGSHQQGYGNALYHQIPAHEGYEVDQEDFKIRAREGERAESGTQERYSGSLFHIRQSFLANGSTFYRSRFFIAVRYQTGSFLMNTSQIYLAHCPIDLNCTNSSNWPPIR